MNGYDKMHQSLLDGNKVGLFIEAFSLHLYRAFYMNGWLPYKLHSLKPYDDIKMKDTTAFCLIGMRINIFCIIDMHCKKHLGATKTAEQKILLQKIYFQLHVKYKYCLYAFKYGCGVI